MKILVTGSEGSLGQALIPKLMKNRHQVIGVDNLSRYGGRLGIAECSYPFVRTDLTIFDNINYLLEEEKPDYVIQLAAKIFGVGGFNAHCSDILGDDITLHRNVLVASLRHKVQRVVFCSSSMVYEKVELSPSSEEMVDEAVAPATEYGLSKFVNERLSIAYWKQYGLSYTIWRPFNVLTKYEESTGALGDSHVFADFIKAIVIDQLDTVPILGDGQQIRCFTHIDEISQAIADHSFCDITKNQIYNIGNVEPVTMEELARRIKYIAATEFGLFHDEKVNFNCLTPYKNDVRVRIPDCSKAKKDLKWEAKIKLDDSLRECIGSVIASGKAKKA